MKLLWRVGRGFGAVGIILAGAAGLAFVSGLFGESSIGFSRPGGTSSFIGTDFGSVLFALALAALLFALGLGMQRIARFRGLRNPATVEYFSGGAARPAVATRQKPMNASGPVAAPEVGRITTLAELIRSVEDWPEGGWLCLPPDPVHWHPHSPAALYVHGLPEPPTGEVMMATPVVEAREWVRRARVLDPAADDRVIAAVLRIWEQLPDDSVPAEAADLLVSEIGEDAPLTYTEAVEVISLVTGKYDGSAESAWRSALGLDPLR